MKKTLTFEYFEGEFVLILEGKRILEINESKLTLSTKQLYMNLFKNQREVTTYDIVNGIDSGNEQIKNKGLFIIGHLQKIIQECEVGVNEIIEKRCLGEKAEASIYVK